MWFKKFPRLRHTQSETDFKDVVCANCETQFDGHFCPNCGQAVKDYDKPISFVFYNFMGDFFSFDMRFFRTLVALLFKPGYLSREYVEGRRVKYAPPFRIFVFVSFMLFLLLQNYTNRGLTTVLDKDLGETENSIDSILVTDSLADVVANEMNADELVVANSVLPENDISVDIVVSDEEEYLDFDFESFKNAKDLREIFAKVAINLEEKLETEEDPGARRKLREQISLCRSPEQANAKILKYISWAFFLLLPLFALILKLMYIRRKQNYMRHLIFSIHIHSFIYIVMTLIVGLYMSVSGNLDIVTSIIVFALPIYIVIAMKRFYQQSVRKTIFKFFVVSFIYNNIFLALVVVAILNALQII